ncbi:MAG: hypothetical protein F6K40_37995 [Okeania sp. SIO3I5]|uniref:hypothetical protein n=1 Tax=Okeania sp. SIO3I5 TaxID=2607805 RepID=UPI0013BE6989|nr:hypothetical protein [Okeania sp. SIO3I5]NEQ41673.1 hypothetical protein [Okeania sp. SIO3I5]
MIFKSHHLLIFLLVTSSVPNLITHKPVSAQTVHRCKLIQTISGNKFYRVEPNIPGSREMTSFNHIKCLVPVTDRKCFYRTSSKYQWRRCGTTNIVGLPFDGYGEVLEDDDGRKYYGFNSGYEFYFD